MREVFAEIGMAVINGLKDKPNQKLKNLFTSMIFGLCIISVIDYIMNMEPPYDWGLLTRMPFHTVFSIFLLGTALIIHCSVRSDKTGNISISSFLFAAAPFIFCIGIWQVLVVLDETEIIPYIVLVFGFLLSTVLYYAMEKSASFKRVAQSAVLSEQRARESESRYRHLIENTKIIAWELDLTSFRFIYVSLHAVKLLGYTIQEWRAENFWVDHIHPDDRENAISVCEIATEAGEDHDFEYRMIKSDNTFIWMRNIVTVNKDLDGLPISLSGFLVNINDEKRAQEKLQATKEAAEQANLAKSEFLASMSHELRTPLNAILGFGQMLQINPKEELSTIQNEYVENILTGGNHLLKLINEILDLSQIEANQMAIYLEDIDAKEVIGNCIVQISPLGTARGIKIINRIKADSNAVLRTDEMRFKQIIVNLLSNAVKYNNDGGMITIDCRKTKTGFLRISITDTGIGIAEQDHAIVFNMFQRLGSNSEIAREGNGIGLTICKLLTEQLGGRIDFESRQGEGSTFWIELPLASNKEILIWSDSLRVGVDAIDMDHQILISLNNKVSNGFYDETKLDSIIQALIEYTQYHFKREETIMEVCGCPELEEHRELHQKLIADVNKLASDWQVNKDPEMRHQLSHFLRDWLINHIMKVDTKITQYTEGKSKKIRQALKNLEED